MNEFGGLGETRSGELCAICGNAIAVSMDHIPPKGVFLKPRPAKLITVPACSSCNNGSSHADERFIAFLAFHITHAAKGVDNKVWFEKARKIVQRSRGIYSEVVESARPYWFRSHIPFCLEEGIATLWDSAAHTEVITRITRGLFYHHFHSVLSSQAVISVGWHAGVGDELNSALDKMKYVDIGCGAFRYWFERVSEPAEVSCWWYEFYGCHFASASVSTERRS